jgi:hypothetical protein
MTDDELEARMQQAISAGPLEPSGEAWQRVAARPSKKRSVIRPLLVGGAALAAGIAALLVLLRQNPRVESLPPRVAIPSEKVEPSFFSPDPLMAQSNAPMFPVVPADDPIGLRLRAGTWAYRSQLGDDSIGSYRYTTERTTLNGVPAWLLIDGKAEPTQTRRGTDSLWTTADSMRPLMRVSLMSSGRREITFREEDVLIGTTRNGYTTWQTVALRDTSRKQLGAIIRWPEIATMLQTAHLTPVWKGSIPMSGSGEFGMINPVWFNFKVDGSDTVSVPAGTFDAWRIGLDMKSSLDSLIKGERPGITLWVSKEKQWLVQQRIVIPGKQTWKHVLTSGKEE